MHNTKPLVTKFNEGLFDILDPEVFSNLGKKNTTFKLLMHIRSRHNCLRSACTTAIKAAKI